MVRGEDVESALTLEKKCFQWKERDHIAYLSANAQPSSLQAAKRL